MNRFLKNILVSALLVAMVSVFATTTVNAQEKWYAPTHGEFNHKVYDAPDSEIFGERYTQAQVWWIVYSLMNIFNSGAFSECISTLTLPEGVAITTEQINSCTAPEGASLGPVLDLARFADQLRNTKPASGTQYIAQKLNIVHEANAQSAGNGVGYTTLSGAQYLWGAARNMAYGLMVLVVIALAFGIMLRVKLNPQTVITIQSAIPKVVIALIAITFSFAIAGLLIDLAFLVQGVVASFIYASGLIESGGSFGLSEFLRVLNSPAEGMLGFGGMVVLMALVPTAVVAAGGAILIPGVTSGAALVGGIVMLLLLMLVFILALLKIIWLFLRTYAVLMINIVFAPFIILGGAVNMGGGIVGWIKVIVAQLSVFVTATLLILLAHLFMWGSNFGGNGNGNVFAASDFLDPYHIRTSGVGSIGSAVVPGLGSVDAGMLGFAVGLVLLLSIPSLASFVRDSISKPARLDLGIGGAFGVVPMGMGMVTDRYLKYGKPSADLAAAESRAKANPTPRNIRNVSIIQDQQDFLRGLSRGKIGGGRR